MNSFSIILPVSKFFFKRFLPTIQKIWKRMLSLDHDERKHKKILLIGVYKIYDKWFKNGNLKKKRNTLFPFTFPLQLFLYRVCWHELNLIHSKFLWRYFYFFLDRYGTQCLWIKWYEINAAHVQNMERLMLIILFACAVYGIEAP